MPEETLAEVSTVVSENNPEAVRRAVREFLSAGRQNDLQAVKEAVAFADDSLVGQIGERMTEQRDAGAPFVSFGAQPETIDGGKTSVLSWASSGSDHCIASGAWEGTRNIDGTFRTPALQESQRYVLTCVGPGGSTKARVDVFVRGAAGSVPDETVDPAPAPAPVPPPSASAPDRRDQPESGGESPVPGETAAPPSTPAEPLPAPRVVLRATVDEVLSGQSVELSWWSRYADQCEASGAWSGRVARQGVQTVGPLTAPSSFTLTCRGEGGRGVAMANVDVEGLLQVGWTPPSTNTDGTPLDDLQRYRLYFGKESGRYRNMVVVGDPSRTQRSVRVPLGRYYVVMTAMNAADRESEVSNEIVRNVR